MQLYRKHLQSACKKSAVIYEFGAVSFTSMRNFSVRSICTFIISDRRILSRISGIHCPDYCTFILVNCSQNRGRNEKNMLFTRDERVFLQKTTVKDAEGARCAKKGLSEKERRKLIYLDEMNFLTKGEHLISNFEELEMYM